MSKEYDGWVLKNKRGTFCLYFIGSRRKDVVRIIGERRWEAWKAQGRKIVKIKFMEVR